MRNPGARWVGALALLMAACSGPVSGGGHDSGQSNEPPTVVEVDGPDAEAGTRMELRLLGGNVGDASTALVTVRELRVTSAGRQLPVDVARAPLDVANGQHAWLAGTFQVPDAAETVQVTLVLDSYGGFVDLGGSGEVDARGAPLTFEAPVKLLRLRGRAVVQLDVSRSLVAAGEERRVLVPQYLVTY